KACRAVEAHLRDVTSPIATHASRLLDHHLAHAHLPHDSEWSASELASAAATFSALTRQYGDPRLRSAREVLLRSLSSTGQLRDPALLGVGAAGASLGVSPAEGIIALATLGHELPDAVRSEDVEKLVAYFDTTAVRDVPGGTFVGWTQYPPPVPRRALRW